MTQAEATAIVGSLGRPSKMPGKAYGIPAHHCHMGSKLVDVKGSVCENCYALKGRYVMPNVQAAEEKRFASLTDPRWVANMVFLIGDEEWFRWHDSGDLQDVEHLARICEVARRTPKTHHWLPTREYKIVEDYRKAGGVIPENLVVRLSAHMVDGPAPSGYGLPTSQVVTDGTYTCHAREHGNHCDGSGPDGSDCRACWDPEVANVSYPQH